MKIIAIIENTACSNDLCEEHGLSLYIEQNGLHILFDMGQSCNFAENALRLGIDLQAVDVAVLSHGHYDHGGGLTTFLQANDHAPVYVNPYAFDLHHHGAERYIGLDQGLANHPHLRFSDGEIAPNMTLHHDLDALVQPIDSAGLHCLQNGVLTPEDYRHEQYLLVQNGEKRVLFSGCSHRGIVNIVSHFRPDVCIGGFHCSKWEAPRLHQLAADLCAFPTQFYTCHCTGVAPFQRLHDLMGDQVQYLAGGQSIEI